MCLCQDRKSARNPESTSLNESLETYEHPNVITFWARRPLLELFGKECSSASLSWKFARGILHGSWKPPWNLGLDVMGCVLGAWPSLGWLGSLVPNLKAGPGGMVSIDELDEVLMDEFAMNYDEMDEVNYDEWVPGGLMKFRWMTHDETMMDGEFAILQLAGFEVVKDFLDHKNRQEIAGCKCSKELLDIVRTLWPTTAQRHLVLVLKWFKSLGSHGCCSQNPWSNPSSQDLRPCHHPQGLLPCQLCDLTAGRWSMFHHVVRTSQWLMDYLWVNGGLSHGSLNVPIEHHPTIRYYGL